MFYLETQANKDYSWCKILVFVAQKKNFSKHSTEDIVTKYQQLYLFYSNNNQYENSILITFEPNRVI